MSTMLQTITTKPIPWMSLLISDVAIDPWLLEQLREVAAARGLHTESLVNLWLQERLLGDEMPV